jgi:hypothetical protein
VRTLLRIGIVGTFDLENFGDLLFPILARSELEKRLDRPELVIYSYHAKCADSWPYEVRSLVDLPREIEGLDLLIVGGGHLVRFGERVAPGYHPPSPTIHHPTGYWLAPTLLAASYDVPAAWNAVSASLGTPVWARGLLRRGVESAAYVSVRDRPSREELLDVAPGALVELVPDTAFGIRALLPSEPSEAFRRFGDVLGLEEPYVVVQASPELAPHARQIDEALAEVRAAGCAVLELPVSPCLHDEPGATGVAMPMLRPSGWPPPLLLAEIVSRADAVVARSLHLSIVALACGVPVHRHQQLPDRVPKYEALHGLGVVWWDHDTDGGCLIRRALGRVEPGRQIARLLERVASHWDAIAQLAGGRARGGAEIVAEMIAQWTSELEALHALSEGHSVVASDIVRG